jgi:hypothetical protein
MLSGQEPNREVVRVIGKRAKRALRSLRLSQGRLREFARLAPDPSLREGRLFRMTIMSCCEAVDLGGHDEVALGQAVDLVGPHCDFGFAPG